MVWKNYDFIQWVIVIEMEIVEKEYIYVLMVRGKMFLKGGNILGEF